MPVCKPVVVLAGLLWSVALASGATAENPTEKRLPEPYADIIQAARERHREFEESATFELRAVGQVAGVPVALIDINGHPCLFIETVGIFGRNVRSIDVNRQQVVLHDFRTKTDQVLHVVNPRPVEFPTLSEEMIEHLLSPAAQQRHNQIEHLPIEIVQSWGKINRDGREQILLNYLRMGVVRGVLLDFNGNAGSGYSASLLAAEARRRSEARRLAFLASLGEEQRLIFTEPARMVDFRRPPSPLELEKMEARRRELETAQARIVAALTPAQKELYDAWRGMITAGQTP